MAAKFCIYKNGKRKYSFKSDFYPRLVTKNARFCLIELQQEMAQKNILIILLFAVA